MTKPFRVLFIYPNTMMATLVPIHISLLSACLKEKGIEVSLFDSTFYKTEDINFELKKVELLQIKPFNYEEKGIILNYEDINESLREKILEFQPDLIAITLVEDTSELAFSMLEGILDLNVPVIAGGVYVSFSPDEVISLDSVDMVCIGEGEGALVELCEKMATGEDHSSIRNLWIKRDGEIIRNPLRPLVDINALPFIDYDIFGKERLYRPMFGQIYTMVHVEIDRGCPYDCTYCEAPFLRELFHRNGCGQYYRKKNTDQLMEELRSLVKKYDPDYINFNSETFLAKPLSQLKELAFKYKEIGLPFWCQTRPETITEEKVKLLKEMNCNSLQFGIEQGNEEFRKRILNRFCSNEKMVQALKLVEKYEIPYTVNNIIGFPDETRDLIFDTIELNRKINPRTINCYLFTPYKGTSLYRYCVEKGYLDTEANVHQLLDSVPLQMESISYEELKGLQRTFPLYVKFPKSEWDQIRRAEKFDDEGNTLFEEYSEIFREKYF